VLLNTLAQVSEKVDEPVAHGLFNDLGVLVAEAGITELKPRERVANNGTRTGIVYPQRMDLCATLWMHEKDDLCQG
jgi:hypothetical protein